MNKLKGIITSILLSQIIFIMIPFNIHADTQIVPTYSTSAQTWVNTNGYVYITNYCEGTSAATNSCKLTFTLNSNWYGMIYIDGYDSSNTQWINYQPVFIADGHGEFNYNFWQSSQKVISKVNILSINLVKPDSNVDLSQIISLLTAIENDTSSIDVTLDNSLSQITNVLNQLIISNDYLETLNKLRQWNIPIESLPFYVMVESHGFELVNFYNYRYFQLPVYKIPSNSSIFRAWHNMDVDSYLIFGSSRNFYNKALFEQYFSLLDSSNSNNGVSFLELTQLTTSANSFIIYKLKYRTSSNSNYELKNIASTPDIYFIPIFWSSNAHSNVNISTDFALQFGLSNKLLDDLHILANGSISSNQSASDLQQGTDTMQDKMDDMVDIESGYNQQFNNSLNDIDFTNPIQSNAGILPAANFVITVFNGLVNNPLSILIIIICILTIGKKVIGK